MFKGLPVRVEVRGTRMRLEARTSQRQEQRLLPQMLQSIEVLQLATVDLLALVAQELQANEALELAASAEALTETAAEEHARAAEREWEAVGVRAPGDGVDGKRAFLENQAGAGETLQDFVRQQVAWLALPDDLGRLVVRIAEHLDARGLLAAEPAELAPELGVDAETFGDALAVLQTLEPRGIGARSAIEAMLLQAVGDPDFMTIRRLLTEHLEDLAKNRLPDVARALRWSTEDLAALLDRMRALQPAPAADFVVDEAHPIAADVEVHVVGGEIVVTEAAGAMPELAISADYEALARDRGTDRGVRDYLRDKVRAARELIDAIAGRQATLVRVATAVMREQRRFLAIGRAGLRPLSMTALAERLGLHASTVSRAIAGKYVATPRGTVRLRDFFDGARDGNAASGRGRGAVAEAIAEVIANEDSRRPLSDDEVVVALAARGMTLARRTVTKFRQELGIPSSYRRRRYGRDA